MFQHPHIIAGLAQERQQELRTAAGRQSLARECRQAPRFPEPAQTGRWLRRVIRARRLGVPAAVTVLTISATAMAGGAAASASTTPPASTPQQRAEALIQPSLTYIVIRATGPVSVPFTDGTVQTYQASTVHSCSGSVVESDGVILTAGHCADPSEYRTGLIDDVFARLQQKGMTGQLTPQDAEQNWPVTTKPDLAITVYPTAFAASVDDATALPARILYDEPISRGDVALLQVHPATPLPALQVAAGNPADGSDLITAGYPGSVTSVVDDANLQPTLTPGQVTSTQTYQGAQFTGISSTLSPGMSGGPTVDTSGRILGTGSFGPSGESQQLNFITSTAEVRRVLADNSVPTGLTAADQAWRSGLKDYYTGRYHEAVREFDQVLTAIPGDRSAQQFKAKATASFPLETSSPGHALLILAAAAIIALVAAAASVTLLLRRRRTAAGPVLQPGTEPAHPAVTPA